MDNNNGEIPQNTVETDVNSPDLGSVPSVDVTPSLGVLGDISPEFEAWLQNRRINLRTVLTFQICIDSYGTGISYPVPNAGHGLRWKNLDSHAKPKYRWLPEKPEDAQVYHAPGLSDAIRANDGACWLVSGEADVWAMHSAGIEHVLSVGFSESNVPANLASILQTLGVTNLYIAPDLDGAGSRWASKILGRLLGDEIDLDARQLPAGLGNKGDVGRAWQQYSKANWPFERWLLSLPPLDLKPEIAITKPVKKQGNIPAGYRQLVSDALGIRSFGDKGFSNKAIRCPFHKDTEESAYLHEFYGLKCFGECEGWHSWTEVGVKLGLMSLREYVFNQNSEWSKPNGLLCTEAREVLANLGMVTLSRILDICYSEGIQPGSVMTLKSFAEKVKTFNISVEVLRRVFHEWDQRITAESKKNSLQKSPLLLLLFLEERGNPETNSRERGRHPDKYRLLSPDEVYEALGLPCYPRHYDPITEAGLQSNKQYRAEIYAARPSRQPGYYSRRDLTEPMGISARSARRYDEMAGLEVTPRFEETPIEFVDENSFPEIRENYYTWLRTEKGKTFPPTKEGLAHAKSTWENVYLVKQLTNHYQRKKKEPPSETPPQ